MTLKKTLRTALSFLLLTLFLSCSSAPKTVTVTEKEKLKQDNIFGLQLAEKFESQLRIRNDLEASIYLRGIAEKLTLADRSLKDSPVGVFLHSERPEEAYRNYSLPGNRLYLSVGQLKVLEYEAELAAAIALELSHVKKRHVLARLEKEQAEDTIEGAESFVPKNSVIFLGPGGVFAFSLEENLSAVEDGISILYAAGFDPRGMQSLLKRLEADPKRSPYEARAMEMLVDRARDVNSFYAPLKNPAMNSARFSDIKKRIQKL